MTLTAAKSSPLTGVVRVPGDKSISHRALIFAALAQGRSSITGLLESDDVLRTAAALRAFGVSVEKNADGWNVEGGKWQTPARTIFSGNAGTGVRLLIGAAAGQRIAAKFDGDASLRQRPMGRVLGPLCELGLQASDTNGRLPLAIAASEMSSGVYRLPVASAQVKSAILLAGLGADGETIVEEPVLCRDHTERMLTAFGVKLDLVPLPEGGRHIRLQGGQALRPANVAVPADPSSAAFPIVAALLVPNSDIVVEHVLCNPLRTGLFDTLIEMGADIAFQNNREVGGEPVADIRVRHSSLNGVEVPASRAPSMIDEYPILAVAASFANGVTRMNGLAELRVKESDRLLAISNGLAANNVVHEAGEDWLSVTGHGALVPGGGMVQTFLDHRIAMSFLVMGLASVTPVTIDSAEMIATSFPDFIGSMNRLGAKFSA
ncbi:MAG: 3-phosphoshikimate 1-carboxyvinyltransferase [Aquisalinus sp.]|nr:3-phosphoshikimate 1-carboxyvinyltransferase [Aquisalinus sp.]